MRERARVVFVRSGRDGRRAPQRIESSDRELDLDLGSAQISSVGRSVC